VERLSRRARFPIDSFILVWKCAKGVKIRPSGYDSEMGGAGLRAQLEAGTRRLDDTNLACTT